MRNNQWLLVLLLGGLAMAGCKKSEPEATQETTAEAPPQTAEAKPPEPAPAMVPAAAGADASEPKTQVTDGIPTEEDYEGEAEQVITADNLESQLDKLEAEIQPK